jgi:hypothetical protein
VSAWAALLRSTSACSKSCRCPSPLGFGAPPSGAAAAPLASRCCSTWSFQVEPGEAIPVVLDRAANERRPLLGRERARRRTGARLRRSLARSASPRAGRLADGAGREQRDEGLLIRVGQLDEPAKIAEPL